ncbi:MAG: hypothetical protein MUC48_06455 [Leptolyngbya sp. Prado105]|nr:hypothetical protein [Leptolyngbya sp. Prado105]
MLLGFQRSVLLDDLRSRDRVLTAIKQKLTANGIDVPFPIQQILFHDQTEATDGDRTRQREGWLDKNKLLALVALVRHSKH